MNKNRSLGHRIELQYRKRFIDLGFSFCKTARQASRLADDCKVDLVNIPINLQVKGGKHTALNASATLTDMREALRENFPPNHHYNNQIGVVVHHMLARGRRKDYLELVYLTLNDFKLLAKPDDVYIYRRKKKRFNKPRTLQDIVMSHTDKKPYVLRFRQNDQEMILTSWRVFIYFFKKRYVSN